jgi:hypothetical protein
MCQLINIILSAFYLTCLFQNSYNYHQYFLEAMVRYVCDKQPEVRQAAVYGIGVMAMFGGEQYINAIKGRKNSLIYKFVLCEK